MSDPKIFSVSEAKLVKWSTLTFLAALGVVMLGSAFWTGSYWTGDSMIAASVRANDGYLGGIFQMMSEGEMPLAGRLQLLLFVTAPILCGLLALLAGGLLALELRGKSMRLIALGLAALVLLGTWLGIQSLRLVEDRVYYEKSPWVSTFKTMAYPLAVFAIVYLLCITSLFLRKKLRAAPLAKTA